MPEIITRHDPDCELDRMSLAPAPTHRTIAGIRYSAESYAGAIRRELAALGEALPPAVVADAARWGWDRGTVRPYRVACLLAMGDRPGSGVPSC